MKKLVKVLFVLGVSVLNANAQTNNQFQNITMQVGGISTSGTISAAAFGNLVVTGNTPTVQLASNGTCVVTGVNAGTQGAGVLVFPGSVDNATIIAITNGNAHAWTNTTGYTLLTNFFATPRTGSNYVVTVTPFWFLTNNPNTWTPPGSIYPTNQTPTSFALAVDNTLLTNVIPPLASTSVVGLSWTVMGQ